MKIKQYEVSQKRFEIIKKDCQRIDVIQKKIKTLQMELIEMQDKYRDLHYLGENSTQELTQEQEWELSEMIHKIDHFK